MCQYNISSKSYNFLTFLTVGEDVNFGSDNTQPADDDDGDHNDDSSNEPQGPSPEFCDKGTQTSEEECLKCVPIPVIK